MASDELQTSDRWPAVILAAGLIVSAAIASTTFYKVRSLENTLQVTGSARKDITSDTVRWVGSFSRTVSKEDLKGGYAQMKRDRDIVEKFLKNKGIDADAATFSTVFMEQNWSVPQERQGQEFILRQEVSVRSGDIEGITAIAKATDDLINQGVIFTTQALEYTYSNLPELRIELLKDAVTDARARAKTIAESDRRSVGALKSASIGVVQVLAPESVAVEDYGAYDTQSIEKEVMVTVRTSFQLR